MHRYQLLGVTLESDVPMPGLRSAPAVRDVPTPPPVTFTSGAAPVWAQCDVDDGGLLYASSDGGVDSPRVRVQWLAGRDALGWWYADGCRFVVRADGSAVWGNWPPHFTPADAAVYLVGPVLGWLLRRQGRLVLHASAVDFGDGAVVLCGVGGAGKSTLAAAAVMAGAALIADDGVRLERGAGTWWVQGGGRQVRLWPESAQALVGSADALPRLTPNWDKRGLDAPTAGEGTPHRLALLVVLAMRDASLPAPELSPLAGAEALTDLASCTTVNYLLDARMRAEEFATLGALLREVPVHRLRMPDTLARVGDALAMLRPR